MSTLTEIIAADRKGYSRGYQAGAKRSFRKLNRSTTVSTNTALSLADRWQQVYCASLSAMIINGHWGAKDSEGKHQNFTNVNQYVEAAKQFADAAIKIGGVKQ